MLRAAPHWTAPLLQNVVHYQDLGPWPAIVADVSIIYEVSDSVVGLVLPIYVINILDRFRQNLAVPGKVLWSRFGHFC